MNFPISARILTAALVLWAAGPDTMSFAQDASAFAQSIDIVPYKAVALDTYLPPPPKKTRKNKKADSPYKGFYALFDKDGKVIGEMNCSPKIPNRDPLSLIGHEEKRPLENRFGYVNAPDFGPAFQGVFPILFRDSGACELTKNGLTSQKYKFGVVIEYDVKVAENGTAYGVITKVGPAEDPSKAVAAPQAAQQSATAAPVQ